MPIPAFEPTGILPFGVYDCTLEEIKTRLGSFRTTDQRTRLFEKLQALAAEIRAAGFARFLLIDGSFVTTEPNPNDIDLVLVLWAGHNLRTELAPGQYN